MCKNRITILKEFIKILNDEFVEMVKNLNTPNDNMELFDIGDTITYNSTTNKLSKDVNKPGIYIFYMTSDCDLNANGGFNKEKDSAKLKEGKSNIITTNDTLYLGKAEKSITNRLEKHFGIKKGDKYSLKLNSKYRSHIITNVKVKTFVLKDELVEYSPYILPQIEKKFHNKLNPFVGNK